MKFQKLAQVYSSPEKLQRFLRTLPYNREEKGETFRSAASAWRKQKMHCAEAAVLTAAVLEHRGYPPLLLILDSTDGLCHVLFVFKEKGRWGAVARSRDEGLHGRAPRFRSLRDLAWSFFDPYVDKTGRLVGYKFLDLRDYPTIDWRSSAKNLWALERIMIKPPMKELRSSETRYKKLHRNYLKYGPIPNENTWW